MNIATFSKEAGKPKYKQIITAIENNIKSGDLKKGDQLPSINSLRDTFNFSRDTILMAFNDLKNRGIIHSIVGKGYYVSSEDITISQKIFLLFDELNAFKEDLYNSFLKSLNDSVKVDIFFHHFNINTFRKLIFENLGDYNQYIIMPANLKNTHKILKNLPDDKVYILDQLEPKLNQYAAIYQNFEKNISTILSSVKTQIKNSYVKLILIFDEKTQPKGMKTGFIKFCKNEHIAFEIIGNFVNKKIEKGVVYIIPDDKNLIHIIKKAKEQSLQLKKDFGIISYNDTLLKEIVEGGITTISTDFKKMGENLASIISQKAFLQIENPTKLILRNSL